MEGVEKWEVCVVIRSEIKYKGLFKIIVIANIESGAVLPGSVLSASRVFVPLVLRTILGDRIHYDLHLQFIWKDMEVHGY